MFDNESTEESDPREVEAARFNLNYIQMAGNIGCLGNHRIESFLWNTNAYYVMLNNTIDQYYFL